MSTTVPIISHAGFCGECTFTKTKLYSTGQMTVRSWSELLESHAGRKWGIHRILKIVFFIRKQKTTQGDGGSFYIIGGVFWRLRWMACIWGSRPPPTWRWLAPSRSSGIRGGRGCRWEVSRWAGGRDRRGWCRWWCRGWPRASRAYQGRLGTGDRWDGRKVSFSTWKVP